MSDNKLLVITGITGQQGGSVANIFKTEPGWRIRGVTRDPSNPSNAALRDAGIELVAADMDDPSSLDLAFEGADAIFAVTDFWQFLNPGSPIFAEAERTGRAPNELAMQREEQQGRNIVDAAARAHAQKPLHRFVVSTLSDSRYWSQGEITHNLHFDGKAHCCQYLRTTHAALAARTSYLQVGFYLSNILSTPFLRPRKPSSPSEPWVIPAIGDQDGPFGVPFLDTSHDTGHFVHALMLSPKSPPGTTMLGYSSRISMREYAALWGRVKGVEARVEQLSAEKMVEFGLPEWLALEFEASGGYMTKFGWDGGEPGVKSPEEGGVDVGRLTDLGKWIGRQEWGV